MTKTEAILDSLTAQGVRAKVDSDGDIMIRYQLKMFYIPVGDDDDPYVTVIYPRLHEFKEDEEQLMLLTCNKVSCDIRMLKVYTDLINKSVNASCEFYYTDQDSLHENLRHSLRLLGVVRSTFRSTKDKFRLTVE